MDLAGINEAIARWLPRLGLDGWRVVAAVGSVAEDSYMEVGVHDTARRAFITVAPWLVGEAAQPDWVVDDYESMLDEMVCHELCHILFARQRRYLLTIAERSIGEMAYEATHMAAANLEEHSVDLLSVGLVQAFAEVAHPEWQEVMPSTDPEGIMATLYRSERKPGEGQDHEWLSQELDYSVQVVPLHESGHQLGVHPEWESEIPGLAPAASDWCWCEPKVEHSDPESGVPYGKYLVSHRDKQQRETGDTV